MAAVYGYVQSLDYRHMYNMTDLRGSIPETPIVEGTPLCYISSHPEMSIFLFIIKTAGMEGILNSIQSQSTLFVPLDSYLRKKYDENFFLNLDRGAARTIVLCNMLDKPLSTVFFKTSLRMRLMTKQIGYPIILTNDNDKFTLNCGINIIEPDIFLEGGIIHTTDDVIFPDNWK